jgi:serine protease Do
MSAARVALFAALAVVAIAGAGCRERAVPLDAAPLPVSHGRALYGSGPSSFVDLVAGSRHGVVALRSSIAVKSGPAAMYPGAPEAASDVALGTGVLIESKGLYVLTNDHLVAPAPELKVVLPDGTEVPAKVIGRDLRLDLALVALIPSGPTGALPALTPLPLGDSDELQVGEWLLVLGDAFGDEVSATAGIVSSTGHDGASALTGRAAGLLTTDARIHRGNSGGPVLNTAGQVVGIARATTDRPTELSFVIPINRAREVLDALRDRGTVARGWLGAMVKPVTADLASRLGLPKASGALVTELKAGSPAAQSALRPGDVILRWGDRDVDQRSLPWLVAASPVGVPVLVTIWRNGVAQQLPITTAPMPE